MSSKIADDLRSEVLQDEASLTGLFWQYPELYTLYPEDKVNTKTFLNPVWRFFFGIGRIMADKGLQVFDDIVTHRTVQECGKETEYLGEYRGYPTIKEMMDEMKHSRDNLDAHYAKVMKYAMIRDLIGLFGTKVVVPPPGSNYDYRAMTGDELYHYWNDKLNQVVKDIGNSYEVYDLLDGLEEMIEEIDENPDVGLPFYQSKKMTDISLGWAHGCVYINASFSGKGKTSLMMNKVVLSCIEQNEKLLIVANEEGIKEFRRNLLVTLMGNGTKEYVNRQKFLQGNLSTDEKDKMKRAVQWVRELCGDKGLIKIAVLDTYTIDNVKKIVTHYANRGYTRLIIDTGKPSDGGGNGDRWERFADDFKDIHKLTRANGGGLNLATWVNVQLADAASYQRFLDRTALAECKKIKNEASVVFLGRPLWDDEYEGGAHQLQVYYYKPNELDPNGPPVRDEKYLERMKDNWEQHYYLLFTDKNRRGKSNDTGLHVLVFSVNWNSNRWTEVGWAIVAKTNK